MLAVFALFFKFLYQIKTSEFRKGVSKHIRVALLQKLVLLMFVFKRIYLPDHPWVLHLLLNEYRVFFNDLLYRVNHSVCLTL